MTYDIESHIVHVKFPFSGVYLAGWPMNDFPQMLHETKNIYVVYGDNEPLSRDLAASPAAAASSTSERVFLATEWERRGGETRYK